jgi:hypothetical protein
MPVPFRAISTVARSVARLTLALVTPSTFFSARSTCPTQLAQVIPWTGKVSCFTVAISSTSYSEK